MKLKYSILPLAALVAAIGCSRSIAPEGPAPQVLKVSCSETARICLDANGKSVWNAGDAVSVFYKTETNEKWSYYGDDCASNGLLKYFGDRDVASFPDICALYPYDAKAAISSYVVNASIPATQAYKKGSYDKKSVLLGAKTSSDELNFKYLTGFVSFTLTAPEDTTVASVALETLDDGPLAGDVEIDFTADRPALSPKGTEKTVTVEAGEDYDGTTYFSIAPGTYSAGFRLTVNYVDGTKSVYAWSDPVELAPGHIKPFKFAK